MLQCGWFCLHIGFDNLLFVGQPSYNHAFINVTAGGYDFSFNRLTMRNETYGIWANNSSSGVGWGYSFNDITFVNMNISAIKITSFSCTDVSLANCYAFNCGNSSANFAYYFYTVTGLTIASCDDISSGPINGGGYYICSCSGSAIGDRVEGNGTNGMTGNGFQVINSAFTISGCYFLNAGNGGSSAFPVYISTNSATSIMDCMFLGTKSYDDIVSAGDQNAHVTLMDNRYSAGSSPKWDNSGSFTGAANVTWVATGENGAPTQILVTLSTQGYAWVGGVNATGFYLYFSTATASGYWSARYP